MLNAMRTTFLIAALTGVFMGVGFIVGGQVGMVLALGFALVTNLIAYWNSDKLVLRMQQAHPLDPRSAPNVHDMVAALAERAGIPMPKLYLIDTDQPNAFATGRNPDNGAVAISRGLIRTLEPRELAAVIAHEIAHIRSRDTLTMTITATLAGAISMLAQFGLFFGGRSSSNPLGPIGTIATILIAPLAAVLVQLAISRTREYEADRDGAMISGDPLALASALEKISAQAKHFENPWARRSPGMAHLYLINPLAGRGADNLFATHPEIGNRIAQLHRIANEMQNADPIVSSRQTIVSGRQERVRPFRSGATAGPAWRVPAAGRGIGRTNRGPWG